MTRASALWCVWILGTLFFGFVDDGFLGHVLKSPLSSTHIHPHHCGITINTNGIVLLLMLPTLFLPSCTARRYALYTDIRLVGGRNQYEGRVEVYRSYEWRTVCDSSWDIHEAEVVCRQLGYGYAILAIQGAAFGQGSAHGRQLERDWYCTGSESSLNDCFSNYATCSNSDEASVICSGNGET